MSLLVCRSYHLTTTCVFENHVSTMKSVSQYWSLAMHRDLFPVIQSCFDQYILSQHLLADAQGVSQVSCLIKKYDNVQGHYFSDSMHHCFIWTTSCSGSQQCAYYWFCIVLCVRVDLLYLTVLQFTCVLLTILNPLTLTSTGHTVCLLCVACVCQPWGPAWVCPWSSVCASIQYLIA